MRQVFVWPAERGKKALTQNEQLIFKIILNYKTDQHKTKFVLQKQQTPMQTQQSFTGLTLVDVQRSI